MKKTVENKSLLVNSVENPFSGLLASENISDKSFNTVSSIPILPKDDSGYSEVPSLGDLIFNVNKNEITIKSIEVKTASGAVHRIETNSNTVASKKPYLYHTGSEIASLDSFDGEEGEIIRYCIRRVYADLNKITTSKKSKSSSRACNSFLLYRSDKLRELARENPTLNQTAISKMCGQLWRNERPSVRAKYKDIYTKNIKEMRRFNGLSGNSPTNTRNIKTKNTKRVSTKASEKKTPVKKSTDTPDSRISHVESVGLQDTTPILEVYNNIFHTQYLESVLGGISHGTIEIENNSGLCSQQPSFSHDYCTSFNLLDTTFIDNDSCADTSLSSSSLFTPVKLENIATQASPNTPTIRDSKLGAMVFPNCDNRLGPTNAFGSHALNFPINIHNFSRKDPLSDYHMINTDGLPFFL
ncbi:Silenced mating-type M-specific polypeptide Mc [Zancudomyces culisetae]|uniref:Silenced mating-type M-specific polypeptide Mc n=1 Tax=Zancudomyces culisetae TaxID=1213189 RepID=A0A1R1PGP5_ZANCU|nr:Silenced mating-type M-specific polypeptide Mc [Zancudomyces culisetae]|eukprot:OMH80108.1 Silenced mating-type M-specific polypeptide Mc [Zancudomyces culisetae]